MKNTPEMRNGSRRAGRPGLREGLPIRLEVVGYGLVAAILTSFLHTLMGWLGLSDGLKLALSTVFGVTFFWLLAAYGVWAGIEGENRRVAARQGHQEGTKP